MALKLRCSRQVALSRNALLSQHSAGLDRRFFSKPFTAGALRTRRVHSLASRGVQGSPVLAHHCSGKRIIAARYCPFTSETTTHALPEVLGLLYERPGNSSLATGFRVFQDWAKELSKPT